MTGKSEPHEALFLSAIFFLRTHTANTSNSRSSVRKRCCQHRRAAGHRMRRPRTRRRRLWPALRAGAEPHERLLRSRHRQRAQRRQLSAVVPLLRWPPDVSRVQREHCVQPCDATLRDVECNLTGAMLRVSELRHAHRSARRFPVPAVRALLPRRPRAARLLAGPAVRSGDAPVQLCGARQVRVPGHRSAGSAVVYP